jgi:hypothetical protein
VLAFNPLRAAAAEDSAWTMLGVRLFQIYEANVLWYDVASSQPVESRTRTRNCSTTRARDPVTGSIYVVCASPSSPRREPLYRSLLFNILD